MLLLCGLMIRRNASLVKKPRSRYDRRHMEILLVADGLKLKGKQATISINSTKDLSSYQAFLSLHKLDSLPASNMVMIDGSGEYEVAGVKISGVSAEQEIVYTLTIDSIVLTVGTLSALEKLHSKLPESAILVVNAEADGNPSFVSSVATSVVLFTGLFGKSVGEKVAKTGLQIMNKYTVTADKLPTELQTILLS